VRQSKKKAMHTSLARIGFTVVVRTEFQSASYSPCAAILINLLILAEEVRKDRFVLLVLKTSIGWLATLPVLQF
jgi:hypothetical protein